ncbi:MAG: protein kinase, partial [Thermodesulfobacteriota bacterium]
MTEGRLIKNKLRIVRQVGRGGMGYVYEVFHEGLRVTRALKQIVGDLQDNPEIERRFLHEAQMMARLEHPHIVRVFDIDQEPGFGTYLLMEFIRGRDLGELLREEGRFSYAETLRIGIAVASALDCAHRAGLVHRDIKPANILIEDGTGRPVVTDFGIAKEVESAGDESFTRTGSFVGTYRYSSREQIRSEKGVPIDGRADIYSLGVVLYEIFAGRKYLAGMPELKIASCVGYQDDWQPVLDYPEPPPALFERVILECLAPDRDRRVKSASELVRRLEECRRVESIDLAPAGDAPGEATLAASAATTRTAPAPSQAGATQVAAALGEMTATTRDEPERPQTATETRSQWVALLQGLRGAVDDQAGEFERLLKELIALDLPRDDFRQLDDMSQILHRVERAEGEGQYQEAASNLQGLSDRIQRLNAEIERTVASAIEGRAAELSERWRELVESAGDLLPPERTRAFEPILAPLGELLAANDWEGSREALREANVQLERSRGEARAAASERSGAALGELRATYEALRARSAEAASDAGADPDAVQREVAAALEQGALQAALRRGAEALEAVRGAAARLDRDERTRAEAARRDAEQARASLDLGEAGELAADALQAAEAAQADAEARAARGDARGAAEAFASAAALFTTAVERTRAVAARQVEAAADALREVAQRAATAPSEVVGDARRAAQRLLEGDRPRERRAAIAALREAGAALERALADVAPWQQARDEERRALAARESASALGARTTDLAAADRLVDEARAASARRDFTAARERLAGAAAAFEQVA